MGLSLNPANWAITDAIQGQGSTGEAVKSVLKLNPLVGSADAIKDKYESYIDSFGETVTAPRNSITAVAGDSDSRQDEQQYSYGNNDSESSLQASRDAQGIADANLALNDSEARLRSLLGRIGTTRTQAGQKIADEYSRNRQSGIDQYTQQSEDNTRTRLSRVGDINRKASVGFDSLRRLLGRSGSANQSANLNARQAVNRVASQDRNNAFETFGRNERDIVGAQNTFLTDLDRRKAEAEYQLEQDLIAQEQDIYGDLSSVAGQRAQLNGGNYSAIKSAQSPYQTEIDSRDQILLGLFDKYRPALNAVTQKPQLQDFTVDREKIATQAQGGGDYAPYDTFRRRKTEF